MKTIPIFKIGDLVKVTKQNSYEVTNGWYKNEAWETIIGNIYLIASNDTREHFNILFYDAFCININQKRFLPSCFLEKIN